MSYMRRSCHMPAYIVDSASTHQNEKIINFRSYIGQVPTTECAKVIRARCTKIRTCGILQMFGRSAKEHFKVFL
jgi:hypothetical protein